MDGSGPHYGNLKGTVYYSRCKDDDRWYKTIFIKQNPFTNKLQAMVSNPVMGEPPAGMNQIHPLLLRRLMRN